MPSAAAAAVDADEDDELLDRLEYDDELGFEVKDPPAVAAADELASPPVPPFAALLAASSCAFLCLSSNL